MPKSLTAKLRPTELGMLRMLNHGQSIDEIAKRTGYSTGTVTVYIKRLYPVFGVSDRYAMITEARRRGVVPTPKHGARPRWLTAERLRHLQLAQQDIRHSEIAQRLRKRQGAVDKVFEYIRKQLGAKTTLEAVDIAVRRGFLPGTAPTKLRNPITARECEFLDALASGMTPTQIQADIGGGARSRIRKLRAKMRVATNDKLLDAVERLGFHRFTQRVTRVPRAKIEQVSRHGNPEPLSEREKEVLRLLRRYPQATYDDLSKRLGICSGTITNYVWRLKRFYAVTTREDLLTLSRPTPRDARRCTSIGD